MSRLVRVIVAVAATWVGLGEAVALAQTGAIAGVVNDMTPVD